MDNRPTMPCKWCHNQTPMLGTQMCDGCWELDSRVSMDLPLAEKMVKHYKAMNHRSWLTRFRLWLRKK